MRRRQPSNAVDVLEAFLQVLLEFRHDGAHPAIGVAVLVFLGLQPGNSATMAEIQEALGISQQRTSGLCHMYARKGCVRLTPETKDRRSVKVQLTEKGFRLIDK